MASRKKRESAEEIAKAYDKMGEDLREAGDREIRRFEEAVRLKVASRLAARRLGAADALK